MSFDRRFFLAGAAATGFSGAAWAENSESTRLSGPVSVADFMTQEMLDDVRNGTLSVDCSPAFQAALNIASGKGVSSLQTGKRLRVPSGRYLLSEPIDVIWRSSERIADDRDMRRLTIEGDGSANTAIFYRGDPSVPALRIAGFKSPPGIGSGVSLHLNISGLQLFRDYGLERSGTGLMIEGAAYLRFTDLLIASFDIDLEMVDVLRVFMDGVHMNGGNTGLRVRGSNFSNPNLIKLLNCSASGNVVEGIHIKGGCNVSLDSCAFEGNGSSMQRAKACVLFEDGPQQGGASGLIENCYFENNFAAADVLLDWRDDAAGTIKFTACTFQRTDPKRFSEHHIVLRSRISTLLAHIDACAFKSFGGYPPSAHRSAIEVAGPNVRAFVTACYFQNATESWPTATRSSQAGL